MFRNNKIARRVFYGRESARRRASAAMTPVREAFEGFKATSERSLQDNLFQFRSVFALAWLSPSLNLSRTPVRLEWITSLFIVYINGTSRRQGRTAEESDFR